MRNDRLQITNPLYYYFFWMKSSKTDVIRRIFEDTISIVISIQLLFCYYSKKQTGKTMSAAYASRTRIISHKSSHGRRHLPSLVWSDSKSHFDETLTAINQSPIQLHQSMVTSNWSSLKRIIIAVHIFLVSVSLFTTVTVSFSNLISFAEYLFSSIDYI